MWRVRDTATPVVWRRRALQVFMSRYSLKRIDVGLAQVNLGWNGHHFVSTRAAFDPVHQPQCRSQHSARVLGA